MLTHVLDTSAWIAHIQQEPGWELISDLLRSEKERVGISVLSLIELHGRLRSFGREKEFEQVLEDYRDLFALIVPVDVAIALQGVALRQAATARIPAIDSLIAATAGNHDAILVHRDGHFLSIPETLLKQEKLVTED